ncbi:MAG: dienelactone hydrolase family protein [Actinomycetota bacterium]
MRDLGKDATLHIHAGCHHGFFNDTRAEVYDVRAAHTAFARTVDLFRTSL